MVVMTEMPHDHKPAGLQPHKDPSWPPLGGGDAGFPTSETTEQSAGEAGGEEWGEFQDTEHGSTDATGEEKDGSPKFPLKSNPKILHRCASTPDFGFNDEYSQSSESSVGPEAEEDDQKTEEDAAGPTPAEASSGVAAVVTPTTKPPSGSAWGRAARGGVRRTPSFAEMVKANAEASAEEEAKRAAHLEATTERLRKEREARRKARARHMKLVVTPIKRCSKSTGDLQSLSKIHESAEHEDDFGGGGGGGGFGGIAEHHEEEVLGDTDAMEFYHRKAKGAQNRVSGKMIRPDEAKRKEISVNKREAQRQKQQAAQAAKGGGGKSKNGGAEKATGKGGKGKGGKKR